ncbi:MAG TPA: hypothetical protein VH188_13985 [Chthoniobacterales bacterium]|jgi:hypothetical protein|nr:hypothetical protein [Chthoniobacterales bacterium]
MPRRIITTAPQATGSQAVDTYTDKIIKYIPADVVAAWVAASGIIAGAAATFPKNTALWACFAFGVVVTPLWTLRQTRAPGLPPAYKQAVVSTFAFIVWVFALGGPFLSLGFYNAIWGSLLLIGFTLIVGLYDPD